MRLRAEQYETILASLRSFNDSSRTVEKRRSPRVGLRVTVELILCTKSSGARQHEVHVRDLSSEGIGFTHVEPIQAGSYVLVNFRRGTGDLLSVLYRVAHCHRLSDRVFAVGARLERVLTPDDLQGHDTPKAGSAVPATK